MRVLDVGAGPGKFCIVAGRAVPGSEFVGVEYRPHLVRLATELAERSALSNVRFIEAHALDLDWSEYDAFYFFNPFAEQLFDRTRVIDETVGFNPLNFIWNVAGTKERLADARIGTRVVTYHGLGAAPPSGYECTFAESFGFDRIELWIKTSEPTDRRVAEASR